MCMTVHQSITIHQLKVGSITNSSILQIGAAGLIKGLSNLYNTGGFTEPAPLPGAPPIGTLPDSGSMAALPLVPLSPVGP